MGNCQVSGVEMDCVCFNISISVYNFLFLTEYMEKLFNTACAKFMSKKYLLFLRFGCSIKYISELK